MAVGACNRNIVLPINRIFIAQRRNALQDAVSESRVARLSVQHEVDEAVVGVVYVGDDKRTRVEALAQPGARLRKIRISCEADLDNRTRDVCFARSNEVRVAGGRRDGCQDEER